MSDAIGPGAMTPSELRERTLEFAVRVHRFIQPLLREPDTRHVGMQLFRASTSVASNYRAAGLGRSRKEFTAKIGTVAEEADESLFWIVFLERSGMLPRGREAEIKSLSTEAHELVRIFMASYRTAKRRLREARRRRKEKAARGNNAPPADEPMPG
jgi:four helix bundle protein